MFRYALFGWVISCGLWATDATAAVHGLKLHLLYSYEDKQLQCNATKPGGDISFLVDLDGENVRRVVMSNFPWVWEYQWVYKSIELSADQLARVELFRDSRGEVWLRSLPLREDQMRWMFYEASRRWGLCVVPQPLKSLAPSTPQSLVQRFDVEGLEDSVGLSYAQSIAVEGERSDGQPYRGKFRLTQRKWDGI